MAIDLRDKVHRRMVAVLFAIVLMVSIVSSYYLSGTYLKLDDTPRSDLPMQLSQTSFADAPSGKLKAMLKGSIYETGEQMTVFGACFDGFGYLIANDNALNATITTWYPNGTIWEQDQQMVVVVDPLTGNQSGRWEYQVNMGTTSGTYLTEITCRYQGDIAQAFGEWQNPNWVARIKQIQDSSAEYYSNLTGQVNTFSNTVQSNFSTVINQLDNLSQQVSTGNVNVSAFNYKFADIYNGIKSIDPVYWTVDDTWPILYGGNASFAGWKVDLVNQNDIYVIGNQPYTWNGGTDNVYYFDGSTWAPIALPTTSATPRGVSVLPAASPYAWIFTDEGISINGGAYITTGLPGATDDIVTGKVFQRNAGEAIMAYAWDASGDLGFSNDGGTSFTLTTGSWPSDVPGDYAGISNILWYDNGNQNSYRALFTSDVIDDPALYYNGASYVQTSAPPSGFKLSKSVMLTSSIGYVLADDGAGQSIVLEFDGTGFKEVFRSDSALLTGITAVSQNDIWVTGNSPLGFYHYNGINWQHSSYPYSAGILIGFGQNLSLANVKDAKIIDAKTGYSISDNGVLLKLTSHYDSKLDVIYNQMVNDSAAQSLVHNATFNLLNLTNNNVVSTYNLVNTTNNNVLVTYNLVNTTNNNVLLNGIAINNTNNNVLLVQSSLNQTYMLVNDTYVLLNGAVTLINQTNNNVLAVNQTLAQLYADMLAMNVSLTNNIQNVYDMANTTNNNVLLLTSTVGDMYVLQNNTFNLLNENYLLTNVTNNNVLAINASVSDVKAMLLAMNVTIENINSIVADTQTTVNIINLTVNDIKTIVTETKDIVLAMNASMSADLTEIKSQISDMNLTVNIKLDEILVNQSYMQLYLESTMFPVLNATYQNTVTILQNLGVIQQQLNTTIQLANQTLNVTLETKTGVDELVNKSRRIRAWITV